MLRLVGDEIPFDAVRAVTDPAEIRAMQKAVQSVRVSDDAAGYMIALTDRTRHCRDLRLGASPRATRALYGVSKALAAVSGRDYVTPDDVQELAVPVLCHRLMPAAEAIMAGKTAEDILREILADLPVPPAREDLFADSDEF